MKDLFIHTFELYRLITYEDYFCIKDGLECYPDRTVGDQTKFPFSCTKYKPEGITIRIRKASENEIKKMDRSYVLTVEVNTARLLNEGTYINTIEGREDFARAIHKLNKRIVELFYNVLPEALTINDFKLRRFDITKDIKEIPESVITQFILLMKNMPLFCGYRHYEELNGKGKYIEENSFDIVNESRGIKFTIYDKHKAAVDQNYSDEAQDYFRNTIRMELRCERRYIKKNTKGMDALDAILWMYSNKEKLIEEIYYSMFRGYTGCVFISSYYGKQIVNKLQGSKAKKRKEKMLALMEACQKGRLHDVDELGIAVFRSNDIYNKVKCHFERLGLSPVPIKDKELAFIQSPDSMLGFNEVSDQEKALYRMAKNGTRGKEVFLYVG